MFHPFCSLWIKMLCSVPNNVPEETSQRHSNLLRSEQNSYNEFFRSYSYSKSCLASRFSGHSFQLLHSWRIFKETSLRNRTSCRRIQITEDFNHLLQALRKELVLPENFTLQNHLAVDDMLEIEKNFRILLNLQPSQFSTWHIILPTRKLKMIQKYLLHQKRSKRCHQDIT